MVVVVVQHSPPIAAATATATARAGAAAATAHATAAAPATAAALPAAVWLSAAAVFARASCPGARALGCGPSRPSSTPTGAGGRPTHRRIGAQICANRSQPAEQTQLLLQASKHWVARRNSSPRCPWHPDARLRILSTHTYRQRLETASLVARTRRTKSCRLSTSKACTISCLSRRRRSRESCVQEHHQHHSSPAFGAPVGPGIEALAEWAIGRRQASLRADWS